MRLKHGYTNGTSTNGRTVTKHYLGPDTDQRHRNEVTALSRLAGLVPVPPLVQDLPDGVVTGFVAGTHGQELLDQGYAEQVLRLCGQLARQVHAVDPALLPELGTARAGHRIRGTYPPERPADARRGPADARRPGTTCCPACCTAASASGA